MGDQARARVFCETGSASPLGHRAEPVCQWWPGSRARVLMAGRVLGNSVASWSLSVALAAVAAECAGCGGVSAACRYCPSLRRPSSQRRVGTGRPAGFLRGCGLDTTLLSPGIRFPGVSGPFSSILALWESLEPF